MLYGVFDWAGNRMFDHKSFKSFDDAWEHIDRMFPSDDDMIQLEVQELG